MCLQTEVLKLLIQDHPSSSFGGSTVEVCDSCHKDLMWYKDEMLNLGDTGLSHVSLTSCPWQSLWGHHFPFLYDLVKTSNSSNILVLLSQWGMHSRWPDIQLMLRPFTYLWCTHYLLVLFYQLYVRLPLMCTIGPSIRITRLISDLAIILILSSYSPYASYLPYLPL